jgi:hypothetical protein
LGALLERANAGPASGAAILAGGEAGALISLQAASALAIRVSARPFRTAVDTFIRVREKGYLWNN